MTEQATLIDAKAVQKAIGVLSFFLPIILVIGHLLIRYDQPAFYPSLSEYVYSPIGVFFTGINYTLGVLFFTYKGYPVNRGIIPLSDWQLARITGVACLMVATCQTASCVIVFQSEFQHLLAIVHRIAAAITFISIGLFCLFYFTQENLKDDSDSTKRRVLIYRLSGLIIFISLIVIAYFIWRQSTSCLQPISHSPILWFEWIIIWAFALSWSVKGRLIFG